MTRTDLTALGTHATSTTTRGTYRLFDVTTCDECGAECMAANSMQVLGTSAAKLRGFGITVVRYAPSEISYCDALEACVCDACYVDDEPAIDATVQTRLEALRQRALDAYSNTFGACAEFAADYTDAADRAEAALIAFAETHGVEAWA